ncbi:unnamed protein product [Protopolystoma xenopodis]|uniref:Uncharacterized protein n=1 Tax=Protopolystoma xenopodis TaxID=117903 RepID=A0A3S5BH06_9PLAT|nr:unnamed protein product [Protopolystoma xenopodis]
MGFEHDLLTADSSNSQPAHKTASPGLVSSTVGAPVASIIKENSSATLPSQSLVPSKSISTNIHRVKAARTVIVGSSKVKRRLDSRLKNVKKQQSSNGILSVPKNTLGGRSLTKHLNKKIVPKVKSTATASANSALTSDSVQTTILKSLKRKYPNSKIRTTKIQQDSSGQLSLSKANTGAPIRVHKQIIK